MDTMRGLGGDRYDAAEEVHDLDMIDDAGESEAPPPPIGQDERRMQVRAYNFWAGLLGDRNFPEVDALMGDGRPDFADHAVLLHFDNGLEDPAIAWLGEKLADECDAAGDIHRLADIPGRSLLSRITDHYMQILGNQAPIGFEAEFVNQRGVTILYRGILLPFSTDDSTIDYIYGVINWKELADQHTTDELMAEIGESLARAPRRAADPLTDWADGPASLPDIDDRDVRALDPMPLFGQADSSIPDDADDLSLGDWLAAAREMADAAHSSEDRTRATLYAAIGRAWDFAIAARTAPEDFAELLEESGLKMQSRAPMTPVVKLVFGADYDKTRLTEYAAALTHAQRIGLGRGELGRFLSETPGGLKGVLKAERRMRREEAGRKPREDGPDAVFGRLRSMPPLPLAEVAREGEEFSVVVVRRLPTGEVALVGEVEGDPALVERAARRLVA
ncbi:hypothetical protein RXV95_15500 [Novosphingobium sp. ZN18A2]|uniref:hypothetical protein n=1 Tax=Novosphingobium sp. ZN18A2 TaxID=3079861 RepID=UPI0030CF5798